MVRRTEQGERRFARRSLFGGAVAVGLAAGVSGASATAGAAGAYGPLSFFLLSTPQRVYDSRPGTPPDGTDPTTGANDTKLTTGEVRRIDVSYPLGSVTPSGVPTSSQAVMLTVTVVNVAGPSGGHLKVWADVNEEPSTSALAWAAAGTVVANTVNTGHLDGRIRVKLGGAAGCSADVVIDVLGFYDTP